MRQTQNLSSVDREEFFPLLPAKLKLLAATGGLALLAPTTALAADITIPSGTTVTTTQTLTDDGDTGTVESGGTIDVTDQDGLVLNNDNQTANNNGTIEVERTAGASLAGIGSDGVNSTINNAGTITSTGNLAFGIAAADNDASITNSGSITTTGNGSSGILSTDDDVVILNSGTITTSGSDAEGVFSDDDDARITNSGTITTSGSGSEGIYSAATADNATIINNGTITTTGDGGHGIEVEGTTPTITNTNSISTSGDTAHGVDLDDVDNANLTNSGTITVTGPNSDGIDSEGDNSVFSNSGTINVSGSTGNGIDHEGANVRVTNTGAIATSGASGHAIELDGSGSTVTNSGTVSAVGAGADALNAVSGDNSAVTNTGTMTTSGQDSNVVNVGGDDVSVTNSGTLHNKGSSTGVVATRGHGVIIEGNNASITNSGTIFADDGSSVFLGGSNATLNLNRGSILQGLITYSDASTSTLNYAVGRTAIYTFSDIPSTLNTNGLASSVDGNVVTIFAEDDFKPVVSATMVNALTGEIAGTIEDRSDTSRLGGAVFVATNGASADDLSAQNSVWVSPFGGYLNRFGSNGYEHVFGGIMVGADRAFSPDLRAGLTGGFSLGNTDGSDTVNQSDTYSVFGGAYLSKSWQQTFADINVVAGYLNSDETVSVLNNMVVGGIQDLSVGYDYLFVSPSARIGHTFAALNGELTPSLRARYSGLWQTGNADQSLSALDISNRTLHVLELRGQAAYNFEPVISDHTVFHFGLKTGLDGVFTLGDDVDGNFGASTLNLSLDEDETVLRGFAAAEAVWQARNGAKFLANVEGGYDTAQTLSANVRLGVVLNF